MLLNLGLSLYFFDYKISLKFISANSRVAPIKTISVSRLELMGNLVLARLTDFLKNTLKKLGMDQISQQGNGGF